VTGGQGFRLTGTATDRAGGVYRLSAIAARLVGRTYDVLADETPVAYRIVVRDHETGELLATLEDVTIATSHAVRADQSLLVIRDRDELETLLEAEVRRLSKGTRS